MSSPISSPISPTVKYEYQGWPSIQRPDIKPPNGWSLSLITSVNRVRSHCLSPDGERIAFIWDRDELSDVYVMPATGGWPHRVSSERKAASYWADETPQWSPDGKWLAFTMHGHVHVVEVAGGVPKKISGFASGASSPVWMPDSHGLIVSVERDERSQLLLTNRDGDWPRPLVTRTGGDAWDARPAPDGTQVLYNWRPFDDLNRNDLRRVDLQSGTDGLLSGLAKNRDTSPRWSPTGTMIAFISERSGWNEVWLLDATGEHLRQLTQTGCDIGSIEWSPDGTRLVATINRQGVYDLVLIEAVSGAIRELRTGGGVHSNPHWSPTCGFITFEYESPILPPDLYRVEIDTYHAICTTQQITFSNPPALARNALVSPELVSYKSFDGLEIPAFLYRPSKPNGAAIVNPHGGPSAQYDTSWDILAQYFVAKGYTWLAPNYRGSTGYGTTFEKLNHDDWGVGDSKDCLYGAKFLHSLDWIDPLRIASYGGSYGGYMTICALSRDPEYLFACGINKYGDSNLYSSWAQCNRDLRLYTEVFLGHPSKKRGIYEAGSPIQQVAAVQKPVLILHGLLDDVVPWQASEEWVAALKQAGKTFEYKTYEGEAHGFLKRATQLDVYGRIERFLDWWLWV